jgi:hypothetical protein
MKTPKWKDEGIYMKQGQMKKINLFEATQNISDYTNFVVSEVNDHVLRAAIIDG